MTTIREAIQLLADKDQEVYSHLAEVTAIDLSARTADVTPLNGDPEVFTVRLQATPSLTDGVVAIPKLNSTVVVTWLSNTRAYVALCSEIDEIIIAGAENKITITGADRVLTIDGGTSTVDLDQLDFNGAANGGLVNITPLVDKVNALENDLNTLKGIFSGWVPVVNDGGAVLKTASASWAGQTITPTIAADIEDDKIKH